MKIIVEDVKPFIKDQAVLDDIYRIVTALESMDIFKNLGLLDMKCMIFHAAVASRTEHPTTFDFANRAVFFIFRRYQRYVRQLGHGEIVFG